MKRTESNPTENLSDEERETLRSLLYYPALERIFDADEPRNLSAMRQKMCSTIADLERVIRRGSKADAEKAARAVEAIQTVLNFLDELDTARRKPVI